MKRIVLTCVTVAVCMIGCSDRAQTPAEKSVPPTTSPSPQPPPPLPTVDIAKTRSLFARISGQQIGDKVGRVEMRPEGMLIHPGANRPTSVQFTLDGRIKALTLEGFIGTLPQEAKSVAQAGTVSLQLQADGRTLDTVAIDRNSRYVKKLDLQNVDVLTVTVGNGDGKMWWDWFFVGVVAEE